jgi:hypothetical protein
MDAIDEAILAVAASRSGAATEAQQHLNAARRHAHQMTRRHRQVIEIAGLVAAGARERAEGLALIHSAEFPGDSELVAQMTSAQPTKGTEETRT